MRMGGNGDGMFIVHGSWFIEEFHPPSTANPTSFRPRRNSIAVALK
jgi:hypothetical protein